MKTDLLDSTIHAFNHLEKVTGNAAQAVKKLTNAFPPSRKDHLQKLPLQIRLKAMENIRRHAAESAINFSTLLQHQCPARNVLMGSFIFSETKEGYNFWNKINDKLQNTVSVEETFYGLDFAAGTELE